MFTAAPSKRCEASSTPKATSEEATVVAISDGLTALGLSVRDEQVAAAVTTLFPSGIDGTPQGEVLREVFLFLKQKECRR